MTIDIYLHGKLLVRWPYETEFEITKSSFDMVLTFESRVKEIEISDSEMREFEDLVANGNTN